MATAAKAKVETVSTRQLAGQLAEKHELSQKSANAILEDTIALVTKHLKKGARIRLNGLGILVVRKRGPRMGRNPATGEAIKIKASKKVAFRVAKVQNGAACKVAGALHFRRSGKSHVWRLAEGDNPCDGSRESFDLVYDKPATEKPAEKKPTPRRG